MKTLKSFSKILTMILLALTLTVNAVINTGCTASTYEYKVCAKDVAELLGVELEVIGIFGNELVTKCAILTFSTEDIWKFNFAKAVTIRFENGKYEVAVVNELSDISSNNSVTTAQPENVQIK